MNVLLVHQHDPKGAERAASMLSDAGHSTQRASAEELLEKGDRSAAADLMMVFAETYRERETYAVCERLRESERFGATPLLVAVNMYQMPLANRIKEMPNSHYIFTPLNHSDLEERLHVLTESNDTGEEPGREGSEAW
jgi:CheY-like chemotaxis protein